ncbi:MAG: hypothetical protein IJ764_05890 [Bacteroidales bacterium]|nr:hypothetical protein [Bacteroidales bacterium]
MSIAKYALLILPLLMAACSGSGGYTPKPTAYLRLTLPQHSYQLYDTVALPFVFECAEGTTIEWKRNTSQDKWFDLIYPQYRGVIFISYKAMQSKADLSRQVNDANELLKAHYGIASGVDEQLYVNNEAQVYASTFRLSGRSVASTYQFWATDSIHHFIHGSFYLDRTPNNDSLQPLISYIQSDLDHFLESLRWR